MLTNFFWRHVRTWASQAWATAYQFTVWRRKNLTKKYQMAKLKNVIPKNKSTCWRRKILGRIEFGNALVYGEGSSSKAGVTDPFAVARHFASYCWISGPHNLVLCNAWPIVKLFCRPQKFFDGPHLCPKGLAIYYKVVSLLTDFYLHKRLQNSL